MLQESGEMYLETILILSQKGGPVRSVDIAEHMGFSKPSVSRAMGLLRAGNYIVMDEDNLITLTPAGRAIAEKIYGRHTALTALFTSLGVDPEVAAADACKIEHDISDETFEAVRRFAARLGDC